MNEIYLVRHGLIDEKTILLDDRGKRFANELIDILKDKQINLIASSSETRCIETVTPIAKERKLQIKIYEKFDFINLKPLQDAKLHNDSNTLICYRIEEIDKILSELGQIEFSEETRNTGYEKIIHLTIKNGSIIRNEDILTGHKKKR